MLKNSSFQKLFARNTLRRRILFLVLGAIIVVGTAFSFFSINALSNLGESTKEEGSNAIRSQIEETLLQSTQNNAETHSNILLELANESAILAEYMSQLYSEPELHHNPTLWSFDESVQMAEGGQLFNSEDEPSSIYAPKNVIVDEKYKRDMEISAHLNLIAPSYLDQNSSIIAMYFIHADGDNEFTRYFPNIGLGLVVPPDLRTVEESFFTLSMPENNPSKEPAWIPVYDDPAGRGIIVTVSSPVYTVDGEFIGIVGIDYQVDNLSSSLERNQFPGSYSFVIDENGQSILLKGEGYIDILGITLEEAGNPMQTDLTAIDGVFSPVINQMMQAEDGITSLVVHNSEYLVAYAPLAETGWSLGNVIIADDVLGVAQTLEVEFANQTNSLIYGSLLPTGIAVALLAIMAGFLFAYQLGKPLETLTKTAKEISGGDLTARVPIESTDEFGQLGTAFNQMANELGTLLRTLEDQVADRTQRLEATVELSTYLNSTHTQEELFNELLTQLKDRFGYSEARIFLQDEGKLEFVDLNPRKQNGAAGSAKQSMSDSRMLVSKALKSSQIIRKTYTDSDPEPQNLGDKIAVPISFNQKTIGVLEVANQTQKFNEADINFFSFLANQVASAINNVRLFEEAVSSRQEAEVANKAKTSFLSTISHELKTPLNAILNFAEFVKEGTFGEVNIEQENAMGHIVSGGEHLLSLIDDSLDISRIESETIYLDFIEIDPHELVTEVAENARALIKDKPIDLITNFDDNMPTIRVDKKRTTQIYTNLVSNAAKYTAQGSITLELTTHNEFVRFTVTDTGSGIHPEDFELIFSPFGRGRHSKHMESSTGLGLAITKDLVKLQDGTIDFYSQVGKGSSFYVELPIFSHSRLKTFEIKNETN